MRCTSVYEISYIEIIKVDGNFTSSPAIHCPQQISTSIEKQLSNIHMTYNGQLLSLYNNNYHYYKS